MQSKFFIKENNSGGRGSDQLVVLVVALAVHPAEVAVPANGDDIGKQQTVLQRQEGEVDKLHKRPEHPVGLESRPPSGVEALLGAFALHGGHAAEEDSNHDGSEERLVGRHSRQRLDTGISKGDATGQETQPGGCNRPKNTYNRLVRKFLKKFKKFFILMDLNWVLCWLAKRRGGHGGFRQQNKKIKTYIHRKAPYGLFERHRGSSGPFSQPAAER